MNALSLMLASSGLIPTGSLAVASSNTVAAVLSALLALCVVALWFEREQPVRARRPVPRPRRRRRPAAGRLGRLAPIARPLS